MRFVVPKFAALAVLFLLAPQTFANSLPEAPATDYSSHRKTFEAAWSELRSGPGPRFDQLRSELDDYPIVDYLDYEVVRPGIHDLDAAGARAFLDDLPASPLRNRFLREYLSHKGRDRRWKDFLGVIDSPPEETTLQCYYYRALRDTGDKAAAWEGASMLWNVGKSQDKACDPLFDRWIRNGGGPDDALVWARALKAFEARSSNLIRYVKRYASDELEPLLDEMWSVYRRPDKLVADAHEPSDYHAQLMTAGIRRLARVNPAQGRRALLNARSVQPFSAAQIASMEAMIARHSLFAQSSAPEAWLKETLARLGDDELVEIFLRNQLRTNQWGQLEQALDWLSEEGQNKDQWRYWRARAVEERGDTEGAAELFNALARERSFHGFLAAEKLGQPHALNAKILEAPSISTKDGIDRVIELVALERTSDARSEWFSLLYRNDQEGQLQLATWALEEGWIDYAISAANFAKAWDYVDLRFPKAFTEDFARVAKAQDLHASELMAIARRESAMNPRARSRVGARGLMQVMPATGKTVALKAGLNWKTSALYEVEYNLAIGSRYYRTLLDRFDGHRPRALAGYNAGPHRVDRWLKNDVPVDQWIDSLPFKETREYVQAVLAYTVIYRERAGESIPVLTDTEWNPKQSG